MTTMVDVVDVLGGKGTLGLRGEIDPLTLHERIRDGFPYRALERLATRFALPKGPLSLVLALPPSTDVRRKRAGRLSGEESDRLYRVARIVAHARRTFGSDEGASIWLREPNHGLGGATPLSLLQTGLGAHQVETLLGRLDHGIAA
ncbi:MAG: antitoxin Xre/MbcA/ParS toxin-binding domain-containing protein [Vicinamibacterales bacterium]